ncbi:MULTISPECIES: energy-coupling factor transporter transmembrane component T family protein [Pseudanabaena]|jgi:energy-coupling factor transport system permease protein|uniref:energy-coupling factor transporter transmembrane component T family protein n=1 Tax=Pseudanabaena TaxID=1152 RepID=UPI002478F66E|nr:MULTISPECIES: energy-coupling factor transporter transmembrane component T [Pseudanabaena]MEA5488688.1 energy-coupling factor transporter transmembrane component T [Pseudanabaena sp. CCNP1317]WGS72155.1 energy-coupling factor transporter transmembrane component T [Pseudanabaena galeata CCNP1313]
MKLQTVKYDSLFTRLDFRSKLVVMLSVTILAFLWESPISGGVLMLSVIAACVLAGVRLNYLGTILKVMIPFYIFLILSMGFFNVEQVKLLTHKTELTTLLSLPQTWWIVGGAKMSLEGTLYGLNIVFKTLTMILVIPLAIFTTDVNQMTVGMVRAKIPYKVVFIFSSTLRFVPLLLEEVQSIIESQRLRGLNFEKMGWLKKAQVYAKVAVPLILNSLSKSQKLEIVLQSKAFSGSSNRTYLHQSALTTPDYLLMTGSILLFVTAIALYFGFGIGKFAWLLYT